MAEAPRLQTIIFYSTDKESNFKNTNNRLYSFKDIKITPIEAHRIFSPAVNNKNVAEDTSIGVIAITIPQLYELVKTYDKNFFGKPLDKYVFYDRM